MSYSKIEVAEAHLCTAIRLFFEDAHPIPVHTLACSAREILTTLGEKLEITTILAEVATLLGVSLIDVQRKAHTFAGFMKHADRDPAATLDNFSDTDNDAIIFFAVHDFGRITGGLPVEAQVYEAWFFATFIKQISRGKVNWQKLVKACIRKFPGVRSAPRLEQKRIGMGAMKKALLDPRLQMSFKRVVTLPEP